jgi:mono/diheme cytochrome c family protein
MTLVAATILAPILFFSSGAFEASALEPHWPITTKILVFVRDRSIHTSAKGIIPPALDEEELVLKGAMQYDEMCAQCHLAPGKPENEITQGLYPSPPKLHDMEHAPHDPAATFWVIKNGLKMTGMPAWGPTHDDDTIWSMVAFIQKLDGMSAGQYADYQHRAHEMGIPHSHDE